jgi:hypothetical protein
MSKLTLEMLNDKTKNEKLRCKKCGQEVQWVMGAIRHYPNTHGLPIKKTIIPDYFDLAEEKPIKKPKRKYRKRKPSPETPPESLPELLPQMEKPVIIKAEAVDGGMKITFEAFVPHNLVADMLLPTLF